MAGVLTREASTSRKELELKKVSGSWLLLIAALVALSTAACSDDTAGAAADPTGGADALAVDGGNADAAGSSDAQADAPTTETVGQDAATTDASPDAAASEDADATSDTPVQADATAETATDAAADADAEADTAPDAGPDAVVPADVAADAGPKPAVPTTPPVGLVVVNTDYKSTAVSLLDSKATTVIADAVLTSGSQVSGLSKALSGDVVLAGSVAPDHTIVLIDRYPNSALTFLDGATGAFKAQLSVGSGFISNPQDVVWLSEDKAYVPRFETNATPSIDMADFDEGDDLLIIDPKAQKVTGRIDLSSNAESSTGKVQARPSRAAIVGAEVWVTLASIDATFQKAGHGRIVRVDPGTNTVIGVIDIQVAKNCTTIEHAPELQMVLVACSGTFSAGADQWKESAIVGIDYAIPNQPPSITFVLPGSSVGNAPFQAVLAVVDAFGAVAVSGDGVGPDKLWRFSPKDPAGFEKLGEGASAFSVTAAWADKADKRAIFTDGSQGKLRVFSLANPEKAIELDPIVPSPSTKLPPRALGSR